MCGGTDLETRDHLFFTYPFAVNCWQYLCSGWAPPLSNGHPVLQEVIRSLKFKIQKPFFMEIIMLISWSLWTIRNDFIFKGITPSLYRCKFKFKEELALLVHKAKRKSYIGLKAWVTNIYYI
jgi:hypothetical protein